MQTFDFRRDEKKIYISIKPSADAFGGGANTFAWNFQRYLEKSNIPYTRNLFRASYAIAIADKIKLPALWLAKKSGCFVVHRLDEHFEKNENAYRRKKHARIVGINKLCDVTVFQSEFVRNNVLPFLETKSWAIIRNGADPSIFYNKNGNRQYVGHVTNSVGNKKRLDLLEKVIAGQPHEMFLLVGNHNKSTINFGNYNNVTMVGPVAKRNLPKYYHRMKLMYFPSENDPCPNTVIEAILSGVPVCYNPRGGTVELVRDCGLPLDQIERLLQEYPIFHVNCKEREDLYFDSVAQKYLNLCC